MKKSNVRKLLSMTVAVSALSMLLATGAGAESYAADNTSASSAVTEPGALTPPPPETYNNMSLNGNYLYLADGNANISAIGDGKLSVNAQTTATTVVDVIKADVTLQRFTGTGWVNVNSNLFSRNSSDFVTGDAVFVGVKGFYYRIACIHSINKNGVFEQKITYSGSVLAY
ncbi:MULTISPECIES: hypothetical protein [Paenibacillus]|uniref:Uncharacterized protein n=1 Tax=Paenibacillus albilobatus TaxID=2716884 RepID=A0A920C9M2_9BACL|nr:MULTISPECIES: hypothetical protein [Paenibacillus]GIO31255.1 hypothetical protein J2TS6_23960 [Paenibacillus albilobatus]